MASPPALPNSACMLSAPTDVPIFNAVSADSASSRRTGRGSSCGICWQSSTVDSPSVSYLFRSEQFYFHLLRISDFSISNFSDLSCMVGDLL